MQAFHTGCSTGEPGTRQICLVTLSCHEVLPAGHNTCQSGSSALQGHAPMILWPFKVAPPFKLKGRFYGGRKVCLLLFIWGEKSTQHPNVASETPLRQTSKGHQEVLILGFWVLGFPNITLSQFLLSRGSKWSQTTWAPSWLSGQFSRWFDKIRNNCHFFFFWSKWPLDGVLWQTLESISTGAERDSTRTQWLPFSPALRCYNSGGRQ